MSIRRGFTIVELMIVIVIMAILLVVGVVMFRGYQANTRDKERESDVMALAAYLESIYPIEIKYAYDVIKPAGEYPALPDIKYEYDDSIIMRENFADVSSAIMSPPGVSNHNDRFAPDLPPATGVYIPSEGDRTSAYCNSSAKVCYVRPNAISPTKDQYIYAPGPSANELCTRDVNGYEVSGPCRRFTIYYRSEVDNTVKKVESKHK